MNNDQDDIKSMLDRETVLRSTTRDLRRPSAAMAMRRSSSLAVMSALLGGSLGGPFVFETGRHRGFYDTEPELRPCPHCKTETQKRPFCSPECAGAYKAPPIVQGSKKGKKKSRKDRKKNRG